MKKSNLSVLGVLAMALVFGFMLAGCPVMHPEGTGTDQGADAVAKTIEVTGISVASINPKAQIDVFSGGLSNPEERVYAATGSDAIANQTLSVALYDWPSEGGQSVNRWTGGGEWYVCLRLFDAEGGDYAAYLWKDGQKCAIQEAVTTLDFGDFELAVGDGSSLTVLFHADGGRPATQTRTVPSSGGSVDALPTEPVKAGSTFDGWYTLTDGGGTEFTKSTIVIADLTVVYAKWSQTVDNEASGDIKVSWKVDSAVKSIYFSEFAEVLAFINADDAPSNDYTVTLYADKATAPVVLSRNGTHITLTSGTPKKLRLTGDGSLFTVHMGTLTLSGNIVLEGHDGNTAALVCVETTGKLTMSGGTIRGNTSSSYYGGGVYNKGTFTMSGGTISKNEADYGGGVYSEKGIFTMSGGTISENEADYGGGVFSDKGTFTMSDGTISENIAGFGGGGGVFILGSSSSSFSMSGGTIWGNQTDDSGGGVYISGGTFMLSGEAVISENVAGYVCGGVYNDGGAFTMSGEAVISENVADAYGGGVYNNETFMMSGGTISENEADYGGGVFNSGNFTMSGGIISKNEAYSGGGVYLQRKKTTQFSKEGGIIYGSTTAAGANANTAEDGTAIDVYDNDSHKFKYKRSATAGVNDNLTSIDAGTGFWDGE
jgi:hypothetical protein